MVGWSAAVGSGLLLLLISRLRGFASLLVMCPSSVDELVRRSFVLCAGLMVRCSQFLISLRHTFQVLEVVVVARMTVLLDLEFEVEYSGVVRRLSLCLVPYGLLLNTCFPNESCAERTRHFFW